jgi:hypothetical protein
MPHEFGFLFNSATNAVAPSGAPADSQGFDTFFGRYTDEETSNGAFKFPGNLPTMGVSPVGFGSNLGLDSSSYTMWLLNANPPTTFQSFAGGPRRGEDILLTNVVSFDVKLWDPHYSETTPPSPTAPTVSAAGIDFNHNGVLDPGPGGFADIGHGAAAGDFGWPKNIFCAYGPRVPTAYTLPPAGSNYWATGTGASWYTPPPPFLPQLPLFYAYTVTINNPTTGTPVTVPVNYNNVFDTWFTQFNCDNLTRTYDTPPAPNAALDTIPLAPAPYRPRLGRQWAPSTTYNPGDMVDPINSANGYVYMCTNPPPGPFTSAPAPPAGQPDPFSLSDAIGQPILSGVDGAVQWQAQPPLNVKAIQITVKYLDPSQNVLRQVTIVQSLTQ